MKFELYLDQWIATRETWRWRAVDTKTGAFLFVSVGAGWETADEARGALWGVIRQIAVGSWTNDPNGDVVRAGA